MNINNKTQELIDNRLLRTHHEIQQFEQAISSILEMNEVDHIKNLCLGFEDATENDGVMFGLIHAIESYDKTFGLEIPLKRLAESLPNMLPHAQEWAKTLHRRLLNHDLARRIYAEVISSVDGSIQDIVFRLVNEIKNRNSQKFGTSVLDFVSLVKR
ncbi:hypothetical protein FE783_08055 [Paenibacillus mesophilus]|uniref:Imm30 family immunity protein n=1 Tax=Paenibacillus mesophilus TaxID=2582849 RepID=UPI00110F24C3|nr:Imm30 family immunity protein [Paenibacillus mesophilus]TMV50638.1 hypothetical protein FE783_08055 [Paenibacillus mesophilus]